MVVIAIFVRVVRFALLTSFVVSACDVELGKPWKGGE